MELLAGVIEFAQLEQGLAEKEHTLIHPPIVRIISQKRPKLFDGEFPLLPVVVARRHGKLIVGLLATRPPQRARQRSPQQPVIDR